MLNILSSCIKENNVQLLTLVDKQGVQRYFKRRNIHSVAIHCTAVINTQLCVCTDNHNNVPRQNTHCLYIWTFRNVLVFIETLYLSLLCLNYQQAIILIYTLYKTRLMTNQLFCTCKMTGQFLHVNVLYISRAGYHRMIANIIAIILGPAYKNIIKQNISCKQHL